MLAEGLHFPEGPAFDSSGALWAVELKGGGLIRWQDGSFERIATGGGPNGIVIDAQDRIVFCDSAERSIRRYDPVSKMTETLADQVDGEPLNKPNDLAFDAAGNLLFTCPGESRQEPTGYLCALSPEGQVKKIAAGLYFPNGLAFTADGLELMVAETYRQRLWRGHWNTDTLEWSAPKVWATELDGAPGPDGMCLGADGKLSVAVYGSGAIFVVNADGQMDRRIPLPGLNPTNCAFDPSGELGLVITEAETGCLLSLPEFGTGIPLFTSKGRQSFPEIPNLKRR